MEFTEDYKSGFEAWADAEGVEYDKKQVEMYKETLIMGSIETPADIGKCDIIAFNLAKKTNNLGVFILPVRPVAYRGYQNGFQTEYTQYILDENEKFTVAKQHLNPCVILDKKNQKVAIVFVADKLESVIKKLTVEDESRAENAQKASTEIDEAKKTIQELQEKIDTLNKVLLCSRITNKKDIDLLKSLA